MWTMDRALPAAHDGVTIDLDMADAEARWHSSARAGAAAGIATNADRLASTAVASCERCLAHRPEPSTNVAIESSAQCGLEVREAAIDGSGSE